MPQKSTLKVHEKFFEGRYGGSGGKELIMGGDSIRGGPQGMGEFSERKHDGWKPGEKCSFDLLKGEQLVCLGLRGSR